MFATDVYISFLYSSLYFISFVRLILPSEQIQKPLGHSSTPLSKLWQWFNKLWFTSGRCVDENLLADGANLKRDLIYSSTKFPPENLLNPGVGR